MAGLVDDIGALETQRFAQRRYPWAPCVSGLAFLVGGILFAWFTEGGYIGDRAQRVRYGVSDGLGTPQGKTDEEGGAPTGGQFRSGPRQEVGGPFALPVLGITFVWFLAAAVCFAHAARIASDEFRACLLKPGDLVSMGKLKSVIKEANRELLTDCPLAHRSDGRKAPLGTT